MRKFYDRDNRFSDEVYAQKIQNELFILIGIPGAGKSTWIDKYLNKDNVVIVSSDAIREEIYGDAAVQDNPAKVFEIAHNRVRKAFKEGKDVMFDATNINRKSRRAVINIAKQFDAYIHGVVFATPIEVCLANNAKRERKVPEEAIHKMICRFEFPLFGEGFNNITIVRNFGFNAKSAEKILEECKGFDQQNSHHSLDLYDHCVECGVGIDDDKYPEVKAAALYHDIGKLFTKTGPDDKGECHYIGHPNYGAYILMNDADLCDKYYNYKVTILVNYHMIPYLHGWEKFKKMLENGNAADKKTLEYIEILHKADMEAH